MQILNANKKKMAGIFVLGATLSAQGGIPLDEIIQDVAGADVGSLKVGGAIRANYVFGEDYGDSSGPSRGDNGGNMELDVFRINVDWEQDEWVGKAEYRWYTGCNMFHTLWLGYNLGEEDQVQFGVNRVPFGVGAYGAANSWIFDLHYYIGLSDDMDLGLKYTHASNALKYDFAVYAAAEPNGNGSTADSTRYSYDIIDDGSLNGVYREAGQLNGRVIVSIADDSIPTDLGASLQIGLLKANANSDADDAVSYAAAIHSSSSVGAWNLKLQCSYYDHGLDFNNPLASNDLVQMGAYDYAAPVASKGFVPAATLSYTLDAASYDWLNSITFYVEASAIIKDGVDNAGNDLNDSMMNCVGAAFSCGGWYTYVEYASANGNYFVGPHGDFGANSADEWESRLNINLGYYF